MNINCPACEGEIEVTSDFFGEGLACPHCEHLFQLTADGHVTEYEEPAAAGGGGGSNKKTAIIAIAVAVVAIGGFAALLMSGKDPAQQAASTPPPKPAPSQPANNNGPEPDGEDPMAGMGAPPMDGLPPMDTSSSVSMEPMPPVSIPDSPDGAANAVIVAFAEGNPRGVWDALPAGYQADINRMVHAFAAAADRETADRGLAVANQLVTVLDTKREFILGTEMVANMPFHGALVANWDKMLAVVKTVVESDLMHPDRLAKFDGGNFLGTTGARLLNDVGALIALIPDPKAAQTMDLLGASEAKLLGTTNGVATIEVANAETNAIVRLVQVENRWVPQEMTNQWSMNVEKVIGSFGMLKENQDAMRAMQLQQLAGVEKVLGMLAGVSTQEQFDGVLTQAMIRMTMAGGQGGAPGMPGGPPGDGQFPPPGGMRGNGQFPPPGGMQGNGQFPPPRGQGKGGQKGGSGKGRPPQQ